jgi:hypothetical protein
MNKVVSSNEIIFCLKDLVNVVNEKVIYSFKYILIVIDQINHKMGNFDSYQKLLENED